MARMCLEMMWKWRLCCRFSHFIFHHRLHRLTQIIYPPQNTVLSKRNLRLICVICGETSVLWKNSELTTTSKGIVSNLPRKSRYLPISEYRRDYYICRKGKESEAKSVFLLQPGARTGKDEGAGQQDCRISDISW